MTLQNKYFYKVLPATFINDLYTYYYGERLNIGQPCIINFHGKNIIGVVWKIDEHEAAEIQKKAIEIKKIENILLIPNFSQEYLSFIEKIAYFQIESPGFVLKNAISILSGALKTFVDQKKIDKIIEKYKKTAANSFAKIENHVILNEFQKKAYGELCDAQASQSKKIFLLEGETGSGKTEVYLEMIKDILNADSQAQVLILLPEIALTNAILERIKSRLKIEPFAWHHDLGLANKKEIFLAVQIGFARVIVGARSAIFLPFKKLAAIIIDEEHDSSFKQEQGLIYHTSDLAFLKNSIENCILMFCSATPSLDTIFEVKQKKVHRIFLQSGKTLEQRMKIRIHDMRDETSGDSMISGEVIEMVKKNLAKGAQSMIFLNRRGYNHLIICKKCNNKLCCPNCTAGLTYHKEIGKFYCHYCAFNKESSKISCSICLSNSGFNFKGFGVEKIFELACQLFPSENIILLSSDTMSSEKISDAIAQIESGAAKIIIGTQILAKGHNFPFLGFLAVIDGGLNFSGIDLRSAEKTYQMLHQITGRIGRFDLFGEVLIQTYEPKNIILHALQNHNKTGFYMKELEQRKAFSMPPFCWMIKISFSAMFKEAASIEANKFAGLLHVNENVKILGPAPSAMFKMNKRYRYNVFLQSPKSFNLHEFLCLNLQKMNFNKKVIVRIDVNPLSFI